MNDYRPIALSLGGNIGFTKKYCDMAITALIEAGLTHMKFSKLYITEPVDCEPGMPDFTNAALTGMWPHSLEALHDLCLELEKQSGRPEQHKFNAARTLDIDIIFFGNLECKTERLIIPHIEAENRLFVLEPLAEIAGDWIFPGKNRTVAEQLALLRKRLANESL